MFDSKHVMVERRNGILSPSLALSTSQTFGKKRQKAVTRTLQLMYLASAYPLSIEAKLVPRPG